MAAFLADYRWIGPHGIGRFARELRDRLPALHPLPRCWPLLHPLDPLILAGMLHWLRPQVYFSPGFNPPVRSPVPYVFTIHDLMHLRVPAEAGLAKQLYYRLAVCPAAHRAARVGGIGANSAHPAEFFYDAVWVQQHLSVTGEPLWSGR